MTPTWTILIPTIGQRAGMFQALLDRLLPQTEPCAGRVPILAAFSNGTPPLPEIRQRLLDAVTTDYVSFVDDDDMVSEDFVSSVMGALEQDPDYVGFQVNYFADGKLRGVIDHSLKHGGWREERNPYRWLRDITHINPMRTSAARAGRFDVVAVGQVEDRPWVEQVRDSGLLKTEVYIPHPLYDYLWSRTGSAWRKPERIRQGHGRPAMSHPNFSWLELEDLGRLAVIVPTRGRPENIRKVITAWDETNAWERADLYLAVDADDPQIDSYRRIDEATPIQVIEFPEWMPMVAKLNDATRVVMGDRRYSAIAFAGDDHLPRTPGWARTYLAALHELGTGMVYGDDGYQGAKLSTEWAVTADAVRALGRMVPAPVDHLYCDNAMMDLFGGAGALRHLPEVRIEHMHPAAGKAKSDEQYDKVNSRKQYAGDGAAYHEWRRGAGFLRDVRTILDLRGDRPPATPEPKKQVQRMPRPMRSNNPRRNQRSGPSHLNARPRSQFPFPPAFREIHGATPDEIAFTLADFAKAVPADQEIVELGVFQARTAIIMAWGASLGSGAHVTAIDPWDLAGNVYDPPFTDANTRGMAEFNVARVGYGDRVRLVHDFSVPQASEWYPRRQIGLLFVDGDHTKEGARRDIEAWAPHLAPGAVIAVDDYGHPDWPGVAQAVDELVDEGVLAPIELFHDRLAVTKLADRPVVRTTAITSEGVSPEPSRWVSDDRPIDKTQAVMDIEFPTLRPIETVELPGVRENYDIEISAPLPTYDVEIPDAPQETLGSVRKRARALGLKPVAGGIDAVLKQIEDHEAQR